MFSTGVCGHIYAWFNGAVCYVSSCLHYTYYSHAHPGFTYVLSHIHTVVFKVVNYLCNVVKLFIAVSPCTTNYTWFYVRICCFTYTLSHMYCCVQSSKCCLYLHSHAPLTMHTHAGRQRVITQLVELVDGIVHSIVARLHKSYCSLLGN